MSMGGLTVWSFLMATAHGAGLMVVPVFMGMSMSGAGEHAHHMPAARTGAGSMADHCVGHTGTVATKAPHNALSKPAIRTALAGNTATPPTRYRAKTSLFVCDPLKPKPR